MGQYMTDTERQASKRQWARSPERDFDDVSCQLQVTNLGGIESLELDVPPGITILSGKNTTNRTSVLQSIAAALGANESAATLKTDAQEGHVSLEIDDNEYTRTYTRSETGIHRDGSPYSDDRGVVDTFVSLFNDNPARVAVAQESDLRDLLMQPVDVDEIQRQIQTLQDRRSSLQTEIEEIGEREEQLPGLKEQQVSLQGKLEELEAEIETQEAKIADTDDDGDDAVDSELESLREELNAAERRLEEIERKHTFRKQEFESAKEELGDARAEREEMSASENLTGDIENLETDRKTLRDRRRSLQSAIEDLQTVIQINERLIEDNGGLESFQTDTEVTAALDPDSQTVECWTCGTTVERGDVTNRIETLRKIVAEHRTEREELEQRLSDLDSELRELEQQRERREELESQIEELSQQVESHESRIEELETERATQEEEVEELANQIAKLEQAIKDESSSTAEEAEESRATLTALERKRGRTENELRRVEDQIVEIESLGQKRIQKEETLDDVREELTHLRGHIENREHDLVETLNEMMDDLVEILNYRNISRVWLERLADDTRSATSFQLHIVRETANGSMYEDTIRTLSESEREIVGLVVALAGYLVHNLDREIPFLLFDSVEMIDASRMAALFDYITMNTETQYLVIALLSKDATALEDVPEMPSHTRIRSSTFN